MVKDLQEGAMKKNLVIKVMGFSLTYLGLAAMPLAVVALAIGATHHY